MREISVILSRPITLTVRRSEYKPHGLASYNGFIFNNRIENILDEMEPPYPDVRNIYHYHTL